MADIKKVAVIGAGVMGAGIAAQVANAGVPVVLLDIVLPGTQNRNQLAQGAVAKLLKAQPAAFMSKKAARLVTTGNIEDHLDLLSECGWIVEAVIEKLEIKHDLYKKIDAHRKPGTIVSSNTSTIPLEKLVQGQSDVFKTEFCITHFFNPPRYLRLLELVTSDAFRPALIDDLSQFIDVKLGKSIVACKDSPGFIANRLGTLWIKAALVKAFDLGIEVEEADALLGKPFGIPKTGVFGLVDLVGLDLMGHVEASMAALLPKEDAFHQLRKDLPLLGKMVADGYTGRKGKGGFYRLNRADGGKAREAISLASGDYRAQIKPQLAVLESSRGDLRTLLSGSDKYGRYAWEVMAQTLAYAAMLVGEAADDIAAIDESMRLGYNWKIGPFELIDQLGTGWFTQKLSEGGLPVPAYLQMAGDRPLYRVEQGRRQYLGADGTYRTLERPAGVLMLEDIKRHSTPLIKNGSASLWDIGDGVACFEFTSKMNALDPDMLALLNESIDVVKKGYKALVIYNEGSHFSAGANLGLAAFAANIAAWDLIENIVSGGQQTYLALKYAPFPVVSAPSGMALGGGCEILLHSDAVQAHAESYIGLVECGVGLVPAWGGCKEMLHRWSTHPKSPKGPMAPVAKAFELISTATASKSAHEAREHLFLRTTDRITMNRYRLLSDAKALALELALDYKAPAPPQFNLPGASARVALEAVVASFHRKGAATRHDVVVSKALAEVLSGGDDADPLQPLSEQEVMALEQRVFLQLCRHPDTLARVAHILETGKPLRN
ncbi:3-hydroxyacyl-CoA dehydrogenase/enoyl-CoA hydratase family protein [Allopusillimonas ginsengisoli]|uniref:3-hydroxyacyl-CoA dehydrogenase/enoyl-CoA hydratase family protein n=1 Tax=Allopusillimonas ginsengisoli TaxID=453575 RepID=UPI0010206C1F|nr:3-hydroxyacyl-CoA dehydrogenase/enoyl-CoA hydratase family protein [Allopusillimonas ginsengisoli]TEA76809.1 3-hydroxyacyl-CoA dehydrogenase/enoyl-CoA hydratase family protein [Allopusillimonas ginsengisoli]